MVKKLESVSWQAEEYLVKNHNFLWYLGLIIITAGLGTIAVLFQSWTFLALVILSAITIVISSLRPPRRINYTLDNDGLTEGERHHPYSDFRAFSILDENGHYFAVLIPKKRFGIQTKIYFPTDSGEAIVDALGMRLPMEQVKPDILDKIVNFLRI